MKRFFEKYKTQLIAAVVIAAVLTAAFVFGEPLKTKDINTVSSVNISAETADIVSSQQETESRLPVSSEGVSSLSVSSKESKRSEVSKTYTSEASSEAATSAGSAASGTSHDVRSSLVSVSPQSETVHCSEQTNDGSEVTAESAPSLSEPKEEQPESSQTTSSEVHAEETPPDEQHSCTIMINCGNAVKNDKLSDSIRAVLPGDGVILSLTEASFSDGDTAFTVLQKVCRENGIPLEYSIVPLSGGVYIEGINNLYELDCGSISGWMFSVNGEFPAVGCSEVTLNEGDTIAFLYTCDLGDDVGNHYRGD